MTARGVHSDAATRPPQPRSVSFRPEIWRKNVHVAHPAALGVGTKDTLPPGIPLGLHSVNTAYILLT